jgi:hypothetical protein
MTPPDPFLVEDVYKRPLWASFHEHEALKLQATLMRLLSNRQQVTIDVLADHVGEARITLGYIDLKAVRVSDRALIQAYAPLLSLAHEGIRPQNRLATSRRAPCSICRTAKTVWVGAMLNHGRTPSIATFRSNSNCLARTLKGVRRVKRPHIHTMLHDAQFLP